MTFPAVTIFFDLETSSKEPIGQILNYCFIAVDQNWNEVSRLTGLVKVSPLQLPEPGAIRANKTDILEHQKLAQDSEKEAVRKIGSYLRECRRLNGNKNPSLIGQNSANFDLDYLRTVFIRNGFTPYGFFDHKDMLFLTRYLYATNESFRSKLPPKIVLKDGVEEKKVTFALEHLTQSFGLLEGEQLHESAFDVELSIKLMRLYHQEFGADIRTFDSYRLREFHTNPPKPVIVTRFPIRPSNPLIESWQLYLSQEGKGALWVDLEKFIKNSKTREDALESVSRYKTEGDLAWAVLEQPPAPSEIEEAASTALLLLGPVVSSELYPLTKCYIEQFIYRISPMDHKTLFTALAAYPQLQPEVTSDMAILAKRHWLENASESQRSTAEYQQAFAKYCKYRYGGEMIVQDGKKEDNSDAKRHMTLMQLMADLQKMKEEAGAEDKGVLESLERYYVESAILKELNSSATHT